MTPAWLNPSILEWELNISSWHSGNEDQVRRPYQHWHHANLLVESATSEFERTDVVTTLKRAVDSRLRHLNDVYRFKAIPLADKPDGIVETLGYFGIIRPMLISELLEVRNRVEHQDMEPPSQPRCRELVEFVWYFVRSTDLLVRQVADDFELGGGPDDAYGLTVTIRKDGGWVLELWGWLPPDLLSDVERPSWFRLDLQRSETAQHIKAQQRLAHGETYHETRSDEDVLVEGRILGPGVLIRTLLTRYFEGA